MSDSEKPKSSWQERRQSIKHKWLVPFVYGEWRCEQISERLDRWAFLNICGHVGRFGVLVSIIVGVCVYVMEADERRMEAENQRKAKHYQAWQVINIAQGKPGSGGRIDALQDLHGDGISLAGVDISKARLPKLNLENANLYDANLTGADLRGANLTGADLFDANLTGADLRGANLTEAYLQHANLTGANLFEANLTEAFLPDADLTGADLYDADLTGADLYDANLTGANLYDVNLTGAYLRGANLTEAYLQHAKLAGAYLLDANLAGAELQRSNLRDIKNWQKIQSIELANIYDIDNPPDGFIDWATEHGAVSIEDTEEWKKLLREKRQEKTKKK